MNEEGMLIEKHSVEDLFDTLDRVEKQTTKTNGRVTEIEKRSLGVWVANHQVKSFCIGVGAIGLLISDFRQPVLEWFVSLVF